MRVACADHLLRLAEGGGRLSGEAKGRLVAMAAERLSDLDGLVAKKWLRMLCLLARDGPHAQQVGMLSFSPPPPGYFGDDSWQNQNASLSCSEKGEGMRFAFVP